MKTYTICPECSAINGVDLTREGRPVCGSCKAPLEHIRGGVSALSASQLGKLVENGPLPVVVDFWAPWCAPCKAFAPVFEAAARDLAGELSFVRVDTEANPFAGDVYRVQAIPTLALFKGGLERARQSGALPLEHFKAWISGALA